MALMHWQPFREVDSLRHEMNRLFDSFTPETALMGNGFMPAAEIEETDDAVKLKIELPGLTPEDIDVEVTADSVIVSGERKSETQTEENGVSRSEFRYGSFRRVLALPSRVENTSVEAEYKDGILRLHLPKAEEERNRVVKVDIS